MLCERYFYIFIIATFYLHCASAEKIFRIVYKERPVLKQNPLAIILFHKHPLGRNTEKSNAIDDINLDLKTRDEKLLDGEHYRYESEENRTDYTTDYYELSDSDDGSEMPLEKFDKSVVRSMWKGCYKNVVKKCRKSCTRALKSVCIDGCKDKEKRRFKRNCKDTCKHQFRLEDDGKSSSSSDSSEEYKKDKKKKPPIYFYWVDPYNPYKWR